MWMRSRPDDVQAGSQKIRDYNNSHAERLIIWGSCSDTNNLIMHLEILDQPVLYQVVDPPTLLSGLAAQNLRSKHLVRSPITCIMIFEQAASNIQQLTLRTPVIYCCCWGNSELFEGCYLDAIRDIKASPPQPCC